MGKKNSIERTKLKVDGKEPQEFLRGEEGDTCFFMGTVRHGGRKKAFTGVSLSSNE